LAFSEQIYDDNQMVIYYIIWLYFTLQFHWSAVAGQLSDRVVVWHRLWDPPLIECINVTFSVVREHRSHSMCHILFQCCRRVDVYFMLQR